MIRTTKVRRGSEQEGDFVYIDGEKAWVMAFVRGFEGNLYFFVDIDDLPRYVEAYEFYREDGGNDGQI